MSIKDKVVAEGMKLAASPQVAKLMQDERVMKALMGAMSVPGKVTTFTNEQIEKLAKSMNLATEDEVKDLRRTIRHLEGEIARLEKEKGDKKKS